jgi:RHS repeat-associated protein
MSANRSPQGRWRAPISARSSKSKRTSRLVCESLEDRQLLSLTLNPVPTLTVLPGGWVRTQLKATDTTTGAAITYNLQGATIPTGMLAADGSLAFDPMPSEVGTYKLTAVASDGSLTATQPFTLTVQADTVTTTRISGVVVSAPNVPLAGVPVSVGTLKTTTAADGSFKLDFGSAPPAQGFELTIAGSQVTGSTSYPDVTLGATEALGHDLDTGANNALQWPVTLPALDTKDAVTVSPTSSTTLAPAAVPGLSLTIPAGDILQNGKPYSGPLSLTSIAPSLAPSLAANLNNPLAVYLIEPAGLTFVSPCTIVLPNVGGYKPSVGMEINSLDVDAAGFFSDDSQTGAVSADDKTVALSFNTQTGTPFTAFPVTPFQSIPPTWTANTSAYGTEAAPPIIQSAGAAAPANTGVVPIDNGGLRLSQKVSDYMSLGRDQGVTLVYNSSWANPAPIVQIPYVFSPTDYPSDTGARLVASVSVMTGSAFQQTVSGAAGTTFGLPPGTNFWSLPVTATSTQNVDTALIANMASFPTGVYPYTVQDGVERFTGTAFDGLATNTDSGDFAIVNETTGNFGPGWQVAGYQWITADGDGSVLLADGNGAYRVYGAPSAAGQPYVSPTGDTSTLVKLSNTNYQLTTTDGTVSTFTSSGHLITVVDRNGNTTKFGYNGSGQLTSIVDPANQTTSFTYTGNLVTKISDPAGRPTVLAYDTSGNLKSITDPANGATTYAYDAIHHLTVATSPIGGATTYTYDYAGRVQTVAYADSAKATIHAAVEQGLFNPSQTSTPVGAPLVLPTPTVSMQGTITDPDGNVRTYTLDSLGRVVSASDSTGMLYGQQFGPNGLLLETTDGLGNPNVYMYDARGNVVQVMDAASSAALVRGTLAAPGQTNKYTFTATAGTRIYYNALVQDTGTTNPVTINLILPDGSQDYSIYLNTTYDQGPFTVPETGTYTVQVSEGLPYTTGGVGGSTSSTANFGFQLINVAQAAPLPPFGQTYSGGLDPRLGDLVYRYTGQAGQRLMFINMRQPYQAGVPYQGSIDFTVYGPDNQSLTNEFQYGPADIQNATEVTLPVTGTYFIVGRAEASYGATAPAAVPFQFQVLQPTTTNAGALALSANLTANFTGTGDRTVYTLAGTAGQEILYWPMTDDRNVRIQITGPGGVALPGGNTSNSAGVPIYLPITGNYTVTVEGSAAGSVTFRMTSISALSSLTAGTATSGSVGPTKIVQLNRFTGTAGQRLQFTLSNGSSSAVTGISYNLYGPAGQYIDGYTASQSVTLPLPGIYTVVVAADVSNGLTGSPPFAGGSYSLVFKDISDATVTPSGLGVTHSGTLAVGATTTFTFVAPEGRVVAFDPTTPAPTTYVPNPVEYTITDPFNETIFSGTTDSFSGPIALPRSATYTVTLTNPTFATSSASYGFRILDLTAAPTATFGTTYSKTSLATGSDVYTFTGTPGQVLYYNGLPETSTIPQVELYTPQDVNFENAGYNQYAQFSGSATSDSGVITLSEPGTYYLVVHNISSTAASYGFRLLNPAGGTALTDGTAANGSLTSPGLVNLYRVTANAPGTLMVTFPTNPNGAGATLYSPNNFQQYFGYSSFDNSTQFLPLPVAGTYYLAVGGGSSSSSSSYSVLTSQTPASTATLALNTPTTATLAKANTFDTFTVNLTAGQHLFFNGLDTDAASANVALIDPTGQPLYNLNSSTTSQNSYGFFSVTLTGTYHLEVTAGSAGSYHFALDDPTSAPSVAIGTVTSGSLASAQQVNLLQFQGTVGQRIYFSSSPDPAHVFPGYWQVYGPDFQQIGSYLQFYTGGEDIEATLPATGTYYIQMSDSGATASVSYKYVVLAPPTNTTAITANAAVHSGTIAVLGQHDDYTFSGTLGQHLLLDNTTDPFTAGVINDLAITGPGATNGNRTSYQFDLPFLVPQAGTFQINAPGYDGVTGTYGFKLINLDSSPAITVNQATSGAVPANQATTYRLAGTLGQRFQISTSALSGDTSNSTWELLDPNLEPLSSNDLLSSGPLGSTLSVTLPMTGTYYLVIHGGAANTFTFTVAPVADTPVTASGFNVVHSGTYNANSSSALTYNASAGMPIYFDVTGANTGSLSLTFTSPDNAFTYFFSSSFGAFSQGPIILPESGAWKLNFNNSGAGTVASAYNFDLINVAAAPALALGSSTAGKLSPGLSANFYQFTGTVGQRLVFDSQLAPTGSAALRMELIAPDQSTTSLASDPVQPKGGPFTLAQSGTYYLAVIGTQAVSSASYAFRLSDASHLAALPIGAPVTGSINPSSESVAYMFTGNVGQVIDFHDISVSAKGVATWTVYAPDNSEVGATGYFYTATDLGSDFLATLPATGTYTLLLTGTALNGTAVSYSIQANVAPVGVTQSIPLGNGQVSAKHYTYDPTFSQLSSQTDEVGHQTTYTLDAKGNRLTATQIDPTGVSASLVTTYTYTSTGLVATMTDPLKNVTGYSYNPQGELITITYDQGTAGQTTQTFTYNAAGMPITATDPDGFTTSYAYDGDDRLTKVTNAQSGPTSYVYDLAGNLISVTDPAGDKTSYTLNKRGQTVTKTDPNGTANTTYTYDGNGNLATVTDALKNGTSFTYDSRGHVSSVTNALGHSTSTYDVSGDLVSTTDAAGRTRTFTYDARGHMTSESWLGAGSAVTYMATYAYDGTGAMVAASDPNSSYMYKYDGFGRVSSTTSSATSTTPALVTSYTYDADGNQTGRTIAQVGGPAIATTAYTYDARNRLSKVSQTDAPPASLSATFTYDADGRLTGIQRFNDAAGTQGGYKTTITYDKLGDVLTLTHSGGSTYGYTLTYDGAGRVHSNSSFAGTSTYAYDADSQLKSVTVGSTTTSYTYDLDGNSAATGVTIGADNTLMADATSTYTYDAAGNLVTQTNKASGNVTSYTYDSRDRLTAVVTKNSSNTVLQSTAYTYDVFNRRIATTVTAGSSVSTTGTVYDGSNIALMVNAKGGVTDRVLPGPAVDAVLADDTGTGGILWYLGDAQGSTRLVVDNTGKLRDHIEYDAFGAVTSESAPTTPLLSAYAGRAMDRATGLINDSARTYSAAQHRFLSMDPVGFAGGDTNLYRYVGNNPVNATDPTGLSATTNNTVVALPLDLLSPPQSGNPRKVRIVPGGLS